MPALLMSRESGMAVVLAKPLVFVLAVIVWTAVPPTLSPTTFAFVASPSLVALNQKLISIFSGPEYWS